MYIRSGGSRFSNNFDILLLYVIRIIKLLSGILAVFGHNAWRLLCLTHPISDPTLNNGDSSALSYEATAIVSTHETAQHYRQHICPSLTSFVRFFDCAEGVYSTSSASEPGSCRHPTPRTSTARHGLKRLHHGSAAVAQASRRGWMDDFRRDPPL